jgi:DNA-binding transcriptional LysR family regulator
VDKLAQIRAFLAVARLGSYTAAGRELGMSKAMVSKHVQKLEAALGAQLLLRSTRRVGLTEAGASYRDRMREVVEEIREAEEEIGKLGSEPRGVLRLVAPISFGSFHIARAIADYRRRHPHVSIDMTLADRLPNMVEEGLDLAIFAGTLEDSSLVARRLAEARVVVCGSPAYFEQRGRPEHPEQLREHDCLVYTARQPLEEWAFTLGGRTRRIKVTGSFRCDAGDAMRIAALQGVGVVQLPTYIVGLDIQAGRLEAVLEPFEPAKRPIYAVFHQRRLQTAKVRTFVSFLAEQYYPQPYWEQWARH